jgi:hypothetical protein
MIEALDQTLALFVKHEKPQVSPRLAASFIRNGRQTPIFRDIRSTDGIENAGVGGLMELALYLFLLAFCDSLTPRRGGLAFDRSDAMAVLAGRNRAAHIRGTLGPAVRFCVERHNFATLF